MFEKSLYDLIRGLRNHKGNEKEYIQNSLKECRVEIRGADMDDLKTTALLKLIYLEMFGHDMSWAAFHVLEVMSSQKYMQKRVGYLGAVQSFRTDTEVLMLATNLLKKDLGSSSLNTMSLPISTLPHIITPSLAMSVLSDLMPRLTHSSPTIRKKTIVTLYRLALVYPETLRPAWPKIKERLMDEGEDPSVTAAIVNVVCELGWRRPQDFLPLAPRLFELLVDSGNNWMAIKLIKLFATLTPLEPRLVKKLLPPLTSIIRSTPAMSLLYECINGIIQGGILGGSDDSIGEDEIACLCVSKLRGMIMIEGDPNLKYVALLAFNKIVLTHPSMVAQQEDVIMDCIDSPDISIRLRALDLVVGMVNSDNLMSIVGRLMRQLRNSPSAPTPDEDPGRMSMGVDPMADSDDESPEVNIKSQRKETSNNIPLPVDYKFDVITRILQMCSVDNYNNLMDFDWYIDVLIQLMRNAPGNDSVSSKFSEASDVAEKIGAELRNVAVKVQAVRSTAARAAESIVIGFFNGTLLQSGAGRGALRPVTWVVGEYASSLSSPEDALTALIQITKSLSTSDVIAEALSVCVQTIIKVFAFLAGNEQYMWTAERKTMMSLLMARIIDTLEPLSLHPNLEVQERAVEFLELLRLAAEAAAGQESSTDTREQDPPLLLTQAIPSLFSGFELNSVARTAQSNVPLPPALDLDHAINPNLNELLQSVGSVVYEEADEDEFEVYYHKRPLGPTSLSSEPAINRLAANNEDTVTSYQDGGEEAYLDPDIVARRRAERLERNRDDPFYIGGNDASTGTSTPLHNILRNDNGNDVDIDSIPIMQLDLGSSSTQIPEKPKSARPSKSRQRIQVAADETLTGSGTSTPRNEDSETSLEGHIRSRPSKGKQSLLLVDSSNIGSISLEGDDEHHTRTAIDYERQQREEAEMAKAMQEVERLRLEMQRANERIQAAQGVPPEGTLVKKKVKKKPKATEGDTEPVKPKKKVQLVEGDAGPSESLQVVRKKKRKTRKKADIDEGGLQEVKDVAHSSNVHDA